MGCDVNWLRAQKGLKRAHSNPVCLITQGESSRRDDHFGTLITNVARI